MSSDLETNGKPPKTVEDKLDALTASVDRRFDAVDRRFDALSASVDCRFDEVGKALVEQREYTEFAFNGLKTQFDGLQAQFEEVKTGVGGLRTEMKAGFSGVESRFNRFERKLDQFIDTQLKANALVERRLTALEPPSSPGDAAIPAGR